MCTKSWPTGIFGDLRNIFIPHLSHVSQHSENDKPGHKTGHTVHGAGNQSISATQDLTHIRALASAGKGHLLPDGVSY